MKLALIDKAPNRTRYADYFKFDFDHFHMSSVPVTKLLKKDVDLDIDTDLYDFVILVGSEAAKEYAKVTSVTNYSGQLVNDKFIPISNPAMLAFKPEGKGDFLRAVDKIHKYISGEAKPATAGDYKGICSTKEAKEYLNEIMENACGVVAWDTETTALYPRDGYVLGVSLTYTNKQGRYILTDCLDEECMQILQDIADNNEAVFHNMKFDFKMIAYHLDIKFTRSRVHDTMLMHYVLDENDSHGLKPLALKYTDFGDYDSELDDFKKSYCAAHNMLQEDFTYDLIPFDIISKYACLTHDSQVLMEDGMYKEIGALVRSKSVEKVMSFNHTTGIVEPKPINGWIKESHKSQEWRSLKLFIGSQPTLSGTLQGPKYTLDHKVYLKDRGYTEVKDIRPSIDKILTKELDLSDDAYQVLYGSMLGDGRFDCRNNAGAGFMVSQAEPRKGYAKFKGKLLNCNKLQVVAGGEYKNDMYQYTSEYSLLYSELYHSFEFRDTSEHQKPSLTTEFCAKLDLRAIAIWYMDDGNLANGDTPRIWSRTASEVEIDIMLKRLEELGLHGAKFYRDDDNAFFVWYGEDRKNFFDLVCKYIHEDCWYKIPKNLVVDYPYVWNTTSTEYVYATILDVVPWNPPVGKRGYSTKWCINVEGNHNFYTKTGLVHNCIDTAVTYELFNKFWPIIQKNDKLRFVYEKLLLEGTLFLMDMEEVGIPISKERMSAAFNYLSEEIMQAKEIVYAFDEVKRFEKDTGKIFNPNSVMQLRVVLFDYLGLSPTGKRTKTGAVSTDAEVLQELSEEHPLPAAILTVRQLSKMQNTYISKILPELDKDGRIRTNFNLIFTTSGRLSSSGKFNAQQIPRDNPIIKGCIKAPPGYKIVSQDLATAEMYYAAVLSADKNLQAVFTSGGDFHSTIAHMVFNLPCKVEDVKELYSAERQSAKAISFGILYGSGAKKVAETVSKAAGIEYPLEQAQEDINAYFTKFSKLKKWLKDRKEFIEANGYTYSFFGRKRRLPNVFSSDKGIASHEVRSGINAEVQSLASDVNLFGAIATANEVKFKKLDAKIFMLVHDSIVALVADKDVEEYCEILKRNTQKNLGCSIQGCPIGVDQEIGEDYAFGKFEKVYTLEGDKLSRIPSRK